MAGKQQAAQELRAGRLQRIFCRRPALSSYRTSPSYVFSGTPPAAAAERMLEKAPAAACSRDNRCVRPDTGDTGETALLPGTGAKIIILPQPGKCKGSPGQPFLYLLRVTDVNDAFSGSRKCRKQGIKNGSKGARTLDLPLVRRALIPAELCFHRHEIFEIYILRYSIITAGK